MKKILVSLLILSCFTACAPYIENYPLNENTVNQERRVLGIKDKNRPTIVVAVSGGGSRASALGWTVLQELRRFNYSYGGHTHALVDDVDVISSVSGGSVIAAYYGLYGPERLDAFKTEFLEPDNMQTLGMDAVNPLTWFKIAISGSSSINEIEKLFDRQLFHGRTFADLNRPGKPLVILNSTDMAGGEIFTFTPGQFDDICSDFDRQAISAGVASSAAVPVVLTPVTLQNYSVSHCLGRPIPQWISQKFKHKLSPYLNIEEYKSARYANDLRHGPDIYRDIDYIHLLDGGLADNLGIHGLINSISSIQGPGELLRHINNGDIKKLVVLIINARSGNKNNPLDRSPDHPGLADMVSSVVSVPIDSASSTVNSLLDVLLAQISDASQLAPPDAEFGQMRVYPIVIDFDQLRDSDPGQKALQAQAKAVPTLWSISHENLDVIENAGQLLLHQHPCFQHLLMDLAINAPFIEADFAQAGCSP